ncbi:hypothetical protein K4I79_004183 [Candida tropicalis]
MSARQLFQKAKNYKPDLLKSIQKINRIIANPENSFKLDGSKFKELELSVYHHQQQQQQQQQSKIVDKSNLGINQLIKEKLPSLKYHNPNLKFTIHNILINEENSNKDIKIDNLLKIHGFEDKDNLNIECSGKSGSKIFDELIQRTGAVKINESELVEIPTHPTK